MAERRVLGPGWVMLVAHQILAFAAIALTVAVGVAGIWSVRSARRSPDQRDHRFAVDRLILVVVVTLLVAALTGLTLMAGGDTPRDPLHLLYAPLALVTLPVGWWLGGRARRRRDAWVVIAAVLLLGLEYRLAVTG